MIFFFDDNMTTYERIPYASYMWKFGTTSFRTKEFNYMTEKQLALLDEFWQIPENSTQGWEKKYMAPGQADIYEIKNRYYDFLVEKGFMEGGEETKYKTAREKTSGLYDMGLLNENHRLSEAGRYLLNLSDSLSYDEKTELGISKDSYLYLCQLLKLSLKISKETVRPFIVILYLLSELDYLTYEEFTYLVPLCTSEFTTDYILNSIKDLRQGIGSIDNIIIDFLLARSNYSEGQKRFVNSPFSENLLLSVSMNRKSPKYDKAYVTLYEELHKVYMEGDQTRIVDLFECLGPKKFQNSIGIRWKKLFFNTSLTAKVRKNPQGSLLPLNPAITQNEESFKNWFYLTMHLFKAKATLSDYLDLNRRYLGLTNCFLIEDAKVCLDIVPKQFFNSAISDLYKQAYRSCDLLEYNCPITDICSSLVFNEQNIIDGLNQDLGTNVSTIDDALNEVDRVRYERFNRMVDSKFSDKILLQLLDDFDKREDEEINQLVTDNADIPTIFEYILGIIWYKASDRKGKVLDYLKLSLDANFLPVTHAAGGEADIVYEYKETQDYPEHCVLLEATLAESTNQRRMEMEPVSRHVGNHLLRTGNLKSYGVFATTFLHINVIGDFMNQKDRFYCDAADSNKYIDGMKIIPLQTSDLRSIICNNIKYKDMYPKFETAYNANERHPQKWYDEYVML